MYNFKCGFAFLALLGSSLTACTKEKTPTDTATTAAPIESGLPCTPPAQAPAPSASQEDFDRYSWQLFVALNWPAKSGQRGQPDCDQAIGSTGPLVWQTYKTVEQIFLPDAANPGSWNSGESATRISRINTSTLKNIGIVNIADQAMGGWLIDQRGNPTYYATYVNKTSYDYIVENNFYNADIVSQTQNIQFPVNASDIKTSWRVLTPDDDTNRYLTMQAQVDMFNENGQATGETSSVTLGLVGLHIATKAPGYAQRIWSTFEHIDNVPTKENVDGKWIDKPAEGVFYSYFNGEASGADINHSACLWQQQNDQVVCVPKEGITISTPDPLTRVTPIAAETQKINHLEQQQLAQTVFQYYQLVTTQRPLKPDNSGATLGEPTPAIAANTTMESYIQPDSSCMGCHAMATPAGSNYKADFSYLFKFAQKPGAASENQAE